MSVTVDDLTEEARVLCHQLGSPASRGPTADADVILARLEPQLFEFGITRVGDLTGLDTIGVPVFFACRPNSRGLSVTQGKGLCNTDARLGAIMESLEQAFAERHEALVVETASPRTMVSRGLECLDATATLRWFPQPADDIRPRHWVRGVSLIDARDVHVPFELAGVDFRSDTPWDHSALRMSTIGLAAGTSMAHAALHALLEVMENDATALMEVIGLRSGLLQPVLIRPGRHPEIEETVAKIQAAGLRCSFARFQNDVSATTMAAFVTSPPSRHESLGMRNFAGFACRLEADAAALAALLEAVQSRLTHVAGARDDLNRSSYSLDIQSLHELAGKEVWLDEISGVDPSDCVERKLANLLSALVGRHSDVLLIPLGATEPGIRVVRIIVTGLQTAAGNGVVRLSASTLESLLADKEGFA